MTKYSVIGDKGLPSDPPLKPPMTPRQNHSSGSMNISYDKMFIQQLISALEDTKNMVRPMQAQIHSIDVALAGLKAQVNILAVNVDSLIKIIRDGNGDKPLIQKLQIMESELKDINKYIDEIQATKKSLSLEDKKGKYALAAALISAIVAISGILIPLIAR